MYYFELEYIKRTPRLAFWTRTDDSYATSE
jgi:hypothetical protein